MPATGVASYDDNYYKVSVNVSSTAPNATVAVNGEELENPAEGVILKASQSATVTVTANVGDTFTYAGTTYGGSGTATLTLTYNEITADSVITLG